MNKPFIPVHHGFATVNTKNLIICCLVYLEYLNTQSDIITLECHIPPQNRESFVVPDSVPWPSVSEALNCFFHTHTQRGLTPQNLDYLGRKLLGAG